RPLNGELDRTGDALRPFARRMADAPPGDRGRIWDALLDLLPEADADALVEQVAAADPDAPPPEGEPWEPLRLGELPPVPAFPLPGLPEDAAGLVVEAGRAVGCDPGMVAGPVLATAGGLIGRSASLLMGANHFAHACVFQANVALPGDGKSPSLDYATGPAH